VLTNDEFLIGSSSAKSCDVFYLRKSLSIIEKGYLQEKFGAIPRIKRDSLW